jgi:hypothetical protein
MLGVRRNDGRLALLAAPWKGLAGAGAAETGYSQIKSPLLSEKSQRALHSDSAQANEQERAYAAAAVVRHVAQLLLYVVHGI